MKVFVQSVNFNADKKLVDFVEKKVMGLEKYHDKIIDVEVFLKVQKTSEKEWLIKHHFIMIVKYVQKLLKVGLLYGDIRRNVRWWTKMLL